VPSGFRTPADFRPDVSRRTTQFLWRGRVPAILVASKFARTAEEAVKRTSALIHLLLACVRSKRGLFAACPSLLGSMYRRMGCRWQDITGTCIRRAPSEFPRQRRGRSRLLRENVLRFGGHCTQCDGRTLLQICEGALRPTHRCKASRHGHERHTDLCAFGPLTTTQRGEGKAVRRGNHFRASPADFLWQESFAAADACVSGTAGPQPGFPAETACRLLQATNIIHRDGRRHVGDTCSVRTWQSASSFKRYIIVCVQRQAHQR
jgi:hypothetical protein